MDIVQNFTNMLNDNEARNKKFIADATQPLMNNLKYILTQKEQEDLLNKKRQYEKQKAEEINKNKLEQINLTKQYELKKQAEAQKYGLVKESIKQESINKRTKESLAAKKETEEIS